MRFYYLIIFCMVLSIQACISGSSADRSCTTDADCFSGEVCFNGICNIRCQSDSDCSAGNRCINGVCLPENDTGGGDSGGNDTALERVKRPDFSPQGGTYNQDIEVTIACETEGATIYYNLDGTEPAEDSLIYTGPIPVSGHGTQLTIRAVAIKEGYQKSPDNSATYLITYSVAPPQFSPADGEFHADQIIEITTNTIGADIFFSINGDNPTQESTKYSEPFSLPIPGYNGTYILRARAYLDSISSEISETTYNFVAAEPLFDPLPEVLYEGTHLTLAMTSLTPNASIYYTTDFSNPTPNVPYPGPFDIDLYALEPFPIVMAVAKKDGMRDSLIFSGKYDLPTGKYWHVATYNGGFDQRTGHTSVVFNNKMWVIGGCIKVQLPPCFNDVWYSEKGEVWTQVTYNGGFAQRGGHTGVVFNNKMWVIGGADNIPTVFNDVWYSENGAVWTQATYNGGFNARLYHTSVVFANKMWVIGGRIAPGDTTPLNDVWSSENGTIWTSATYNGGFSQRASHTSVVFANKMWVIGGVHEFWNLLNDVWSSENGTIWTLATYNGGFTGRYSHTSIVFANKMWVIGGGIYIPSQATPMNDAWYSENGVTWFPATYNGVFPKRALMGSIVFDNKMWLIGGASSITTSLNDVWWSD